MPSFTNRCRAPGFVAIALLLLVPLPVSAEPPKAAIKSASTGEWPQFLGPHRNGVSQETGLLTAWPGEGPREVWRVDGGQGMSGPAISCGRLFTLVQRSGRQFVVCLDATDGSPRWEAEVSPAYRNQMGDGPRATPSVSGEVVYVFTGDGVLAALKVGDGTVIWKKDVVAEFGGKPTDYGMACSPLVVGERVIVTVGAPQATVVALSCSTGAVTWAAGSDLPPGYSSPAVLMVGGREQLVAFHGAGAFGLDPTSGEELWSYPYVTDFACNIATPLAVDDRVFLSAGENHGSVLLALKPHGKKFDISPVWESKGPKSVLRNEWQTSVLLDGYLYGFDNVGGAGPVTHLTCIDAATGARKWQQLRFGKGNLIAADGKLFISTVNGELVVVSANPKKFEELGRKEVIGKTRQAPALAGGLLYLRDDREIVCLDVRQP
ncbi:MAG: alcohol dehydrogenase [Planctomycetaceae bacterium]|nr:alcohol dehydrogenase [Planctomycetaceae bacterium]